MSDDERVTASTWRERCWDSICMWCFPKKRYTCLGDVSPEGFVRTKEMGWLVTVIKTHALYLFLLMPTLAVVIAYNSVWVTGPCDELALFLKADNNWMYGVLVSAFYGVTKIAGWIKGQHVVSKVMASGVHTVGTAENLMQLGGRK